MSEWIEYTGSDEQIEEMKSGFLYRNKSGSQSDKALFGNNFVSSAHLKNFLNNCEVAHYLVCDPHPHADLIKIWADTSCPVYVRYTEPTEDGLNMRWRTIKTNTPYWNIPGAEYSLTPFED